MFFGRLAEIAAEYLHKGSLVLVVGRIQTRKWEDKEGRERYTTEIVVQDMKMLSSKSESSNAASSSNDDGYGAPPAQSRPQQQPRRAAGGGGTTAPAADDFDHDIRFREPRLKPPPLSTVIWPALLKLVKPTIAP